MEEVLSALDRLPCTNLSGEPLDMDTMTQDPRILNGVLEACGSIFKRYRNQMKSDRLFAEIKYVLVDCNFQEKLGQVHSLSLYHSLSLCHCHSLSVCPTQLTHT